MIRIDPPDWLVRRPFAHRGLHGPGVPENGLTAFARAREAGYGVELDVRALGDGTLVVFHDDATDRMTGQPGAVAALGVADLAHLPLAGTDERIPTLEAALEVLGARVPVLVEIKNESGRAGSLESAVCAVLSDYPGDAAVMSFAPASVRAVRRARPDGVVGLLASARATTRGVPVGSWRRWLVEFVDEVDVDFVGCDVRGLPWEPVPELRRRVAVLGWTVRSARAEARARRWCDNVIFEGYRAAVPRTGP